MIFYLTMYKVWLLKLVFIGFPPAFSNSNHLNKNNNVQHFQSVHHKLDVQGDSPYVQDSYIPGSFINSQFTASNSDGYSNNGGGYYSSSYSVSSSESPPQQRRKYRRRQNRRYWTTTETNYDTNSDDNSMPMFSDSSSENGGKGRMYSQRRHYNEQQQQQQQNGGNYGYSRRSREQNGGGNRRGNGQGYGYTRQQEVEEEHHTDGSSQDYVGEDETDEQTLEMLQDQYRKQIRQKLLIIVIEGFRYDYMDRFERGSQETLAGFREFQRGGIQAEYLESVFPAESFPAWQTLQTGRYPGNHDIVGNQFYDPEIDRQDKNTQPFFNIDDQRSTQHMKWWQKDEPLWATAKRQNVSFAAYLWGRCDIPYDAERRLRFDYCENLYQKDGSKTLRINVDKALMNFQAGYDAAIIYEDSLERAAEDFGPDSEQLDFKLEQLDKDIQHLSNRLNVTNMADHVNVVILSTHGMAAATSPLRYSPGYIGNEHDIVKIQLSDTLSRENVRWIVGSGSHAKIQPRGLRYRDAIIEQLDKIQNLMVYNKTDIPERFHYKMSKNAPPILVVASPGTVIHSSSPDIQRPVLLDHPHRDLNPQRLTEQMKFGLAGYDPEEHDMRGVFMARGPAFKDNGDTLGPVHLIDVYELLCKVLDIKPRENDGSLEAVLRFLRGSGSQSIISIHLILLSVIIAAINH